MTCLVANLDVSCLVAGVLDPTWIAAAAAGVAASIGFFRFRSRRASPPDPQLVPTTSATLTKYYESLDGELHPQTVADTLPGGLSVAMMPVLHDTRETARQGERVGALLLRNVNAGGSPVSGRTSLRAARVDPSRIERVEFIRVPLGGPGAVAHAQLRFVFEPGAAFLLVPGTHRQEPLEDLVLSWEAWRTPGVDYHMVRGLDPTTYALTLRAYSGPQRFLEDALSERDWYVYDMDSEVLSSETLLRTALRLGDAAGRLHLDHVLSEHEERPGTEWNSVRNALKESAPPEGSTATHEHSDSLGFSTGYQTLIRSCGSMLVHSINEAIRSEDPHSSRFVRQPDVAKDPEWMESIAHASKARVALNVPRALRFVRRYPSAIPGWIPGQLDASGLLVRQDGKLKFRHYSIGHETPWGHRDHLLIR